MFNIDYHDQKKVLEIIKKMMTNDHVFAGKVLETISETWKEIIENQRKSRDSKHRNAIRSSLMCIWKNQIYDNPSPDLFDRLTISDLIDAMDAVYPDSIPDCSAARDIIRHFYNSCLALKIDENDEWICEIKNKSEYIRKLYAKNEDNQK